MKFCRFVFRNCAGSVLKLFETLHASVGDVFWNFQSSRHQAHNSNIFKFYRISWVKSKNPSTPITNLLKLFWLTHLVFSGNPLVGFKIEWPRTAVLTCFFPLLTVRRGLTIINSAKKNIVWARVQSTCAQRSACLTLKQFSIEILVQTFIWYLQFEFGPVPALNCQIQCLINVPNVDQTSLVSVLWVFGSSLCSPSQLYRSLPLKDCRWKLFLKGTLP